MSNAEQQTSAASQGIGSRPARARLNSLKSSRNGPSWKACPISSGCPESGKFFSR